MNLSSGADKRYRVPDLAFWAPDRSPAQADDIFLPPTLAVEIQSPGQTLGFLRTKCREYRDRGIDVAWLVAPARRAIEVFEAGLDGVVRTGADAVESTAPARLPVRGPGAVRRFGRLTAARAFRRR